MTIRPPARYDLGGLTVTVLDAGALRLDGGAMFGIIPKALWSRAIPADEQNRILLACNTLLVEWAAEPDRRLIIETGHGPKYDAKEQRIYGIDATHWLLPSLHAAQIDAATITDVALTHLHFDHAGGLTYVDGERLVRTFPNAIVHAQRAEYDDAHANFGVMTKTYRPENFQPLDDAGAWHLLDGETEFLPQVRSLLTPGHTRGHHSIVVQGTQRTLVYAGDLLPTRHHLGAAYNMGYDLLPLENGAAKERLLRWLADSGGLLAFDHELDTLVVTVHPANDWFRCEPATS